MNKKILNFALLMIVILIVVIFSAMMYFMLSKNKASNSVYDDLAMANNTISKTPSENDLDEEPSDAEVQTSSLQTISVDSEEFKKIYPFTGAFPGVDIIQFISLQDDLKEFSNEQILSLGLAKVTKDDWADSYVGEGEPVSIPASLLDEYIKDIFGQNIQYEKGNFSNKKFTINKHEHTMSSDVVYVPDTDTYIINHIAGDGIGESHVEMSEPTISRIKDNIEVEIPYAFLRYDDEYVTEEVDGEEMSGFAYKIYANCDYETKSFSDEIGSFTEFDRDEDGEFNMDNMIQNILKRNLSKLKKLTLIYSTSEDGTELVLKEVRP